MNWKFCANAGFFGGWRDRFNQYEPTRTVAEKIALVAQVEGVTGIELRYPNDFADVPAVKQMVADHGLAHAAVNVNTKDVTHFRYGALSNRDAAARQHAITLLREAMDLAAELGTPLVTTCPLSDAYSYPFQIDYAVAWENFIDSVRAVTAHRADITLLLEFQPHEPHARVLLSNVGKLLHVCAEVGAPNLGANLDIGHSFSALESPAESATLLAHANRLFHIHTNDNTGDGGDWDMISGSVHFWHWLELLYTLDRVGYDGWLGADIAPRETSSVAAFRTNIIMIQRMSAFVERVGSAKIAELLAQPGNLADVYDQLSAALLP